MTTAAYSETATLAARAVGKSDVFRTARLGERVSLYLSGIKMSETHLRDGTLVERLGEEPTGEQLLRTAAAASTEDFTPIAVNLRDCSGSPLSEEAAAAAEDLIVEALRRRDHAGAVAALRADRGPFLVLDVTFLTGSGQEVTLFAEAAVDD